MSRIRVAGVVAAIVGLVAACGDDSTERNAVGSAAPAGSSERSRTIEIEMVDIAFEPVAVTVQAGETVTFVFTNTGAIQHEATFGDEAEQEEHAAEMREGMDMDGTDESSAVHDDDDASDDGHGDEVSTLVLDPGASGEVTVTFDDPDVSSTIIGCQIPGHWEAGMRLDVTVETA